MTKNFKTNGVQEYQKVYTFLTQENTMDPGSPLERIKAYFETAHLTDEEMGRQGGCVSTKGFVAAMGDPWMQLAYEAERQRTEENNP